jgi:ABC-2 type transport system ATP-binding protein
VATGSTSWSGTRPTCRAPAALVERVAGTAPDIEPATRRVTAPVSDRMDALTAVVHGLRDDGIDAQDLTVRRPTLDEVFLQLTTATGVAA